MATILGIVDRRAGYWGGGVAFPAGCGIIGPMIRSKGGVDVEAGRYNNKPPLRSTILNMVAKPAGTCIIRSMMQQTETQDQDLTQDQADEQSYFENLVARFEADNADIGCEFDC